MSKGWPFYDEATVDAVTAVLASGRVNYWTGSEGREFEREFAEWAGVSHAVAMTNGTVALDVAFKALGIGADDEVIVTPRTFLASVSSVVNAGAVPIFADVDRDSGNITAESIAAVLTPRTRAIVPVHLAGWPCEMAAIMDLARDHRLSVVEDCAQAHGARYRNRSVGSLGHIGAWSFCQDKIISTGGEGGMVTTNDPALWSAMWSYKDHGKSWQAVYEREHPPGYRWVHESFGTNWRMLEVQAAIGRIQIRRMADWHARRSENARILIDGLSGSGLRIPVPPPHVEHAWYKFHAFVRPEALSGGWTRDRIVDEINARGVPCFAGSCSEVYLEKAFDGTGWRPAERLPVARELGESSVMLLVHPTLDHDDMQRTVVEVNAVIAAATR
ncbi:MAG: DegT/DnrJ/EryC1/StrS aminotransferase family protein [Gammaproteobacteria bacterium]